MNRIPFRLVLLFVLMLCADLGLADWESIGNLAASEPSGSEIVFRNAKATVVVTMLAPDIVRVRTIRGTRLPEDHSYAVVKTDWPKVAVEYAGDSETRIIRTPELEVRAHLSPF